MKYWDKYSNEHYQFVFSQGEKKLQATETTMNAIQSRGRFQLLFGLSIITSIITWLLSEPRTELVPYALWVLILTALSVLFAAMGIYKYKIQTIGSDPIDLFHPEFYKPFGDAPGLAEKNLLLNECHDYSSRISFNNRVNRARLRLITYSFLSLCSIPLALALLWTIASLG